MSFTSRWLAALSIALGSAVSVAAPATAEPEDTGASAQSVIDSLKAEGYNPDSSAPAAGMFVTVYVDVSCPNHQDD
jgi:hypothetical protein